MNDVRMNELEGRIEAIAQMLLIVTAALDMNESIDDAIISAGMRHKADRISNLDPAVLDSARRSLRHLADQIDEMKTTRQTRAGQ